MPPKGPLENPRVPPMGPALGGKPSRAPQLSPKSGRWSRIVQGAPNPANPLAHVPSELLLSPGQENLEGVA